MASSMLAIVVSGWISNVKNCEVPVSKLYSVVEV